MSLNKVMLIGNVGKDPTVRYLDKTQADSLAKVANFPLATSERFRDKSGETIERTEWHNIVVYRGLANTIESYVRKGTKLFIEGKIHTRSYTDPNTQATVYVTEIVADNIELLSARPEGGVAPLQGPQTAQPYAQPAQQAAYVPQPAQPQAPKPQAAYAPQPTAPAPAPVPVPEEIDEELPF